MLCIKRLVLMGVAILYGPFARAAQVSQARPAIQLSADFYQDRALSNSNPNPLLRTAAQDRLNEQLQLLRRQNDPIIRGITFEDNDVVSQVSWDDLRSRELFIAVAVGSFGDQRVVNFHWAHSFNHLVGQAEVGYRDPVKRFYFDEPQNIFYFRLKPGEKRAQYYCSFVELIAPDEAGNVLRKAFLDNLNSYAQVRNIGIDVAGYRNSYVRQGVDLFRLRDAQDAIRWRKQNQEFQRQGEAFQRQADQMGAGFRRGAQAAPVPVAPDGAAVLHERRKAFGTWFLRLAFPLALSFGHGLLNNYLARRAGCGLKRWRFYNSPLREWLTGALVRTIQLNYGEYLSKKIRMAAEPHWNPADESFQAKAIRRGYTFFLLSCLTGLMQELGEEVGPRGRWRVLPDVKVARTDNLLAWNLSFLSFMGMEVAMCAGLLGAGLWAGGRYLFVP